MSAYTAMSIQALTTMILIRPDIFLESKYLKYLGWMLNDKDANVRRCAVLGFLAPFKESSKSGGVGGGTSKTVRFDTSRMKTALDKFLSRLADLVLDVDLSVQEVTMELLLTLVRDNFLADLDTDEIWEQINLRAINDQTSPRMRRNALFFVLEQLPPFDEGVAKSENDALTQIDALVSWLAHLLSDSEIPVHNMRFDLMDLVVESLRASEHKPLMRNWSVMLRALGNDSTRLAEDDELIRSDRRLEITKQRLLLRMLVCSAQHEVSASSSDGLIDQDLVQARISAFAIQSETGRSGGKKKNQGATSAPEEFTLALLRTLPELITVFRGETFILQSLTALPQYFDLTALSASDKSPFNDLTARLAEVLLESTDAVVLGNCCLALAALSRGDHALRGQALMCLKETAQQLRDRLRALVQKYYEKLSSTASQSRPDEDTMDEAGPGDILHSISLCLHRLATLSKRWYLGDLITDGGTDDVPKKDQAVLDLYRSVIELARKELESRKITRREHLDDIVDHEDIIIPNIWKSTADRRVHGLAADIIRESFDLLLSMSAWRIQEEVDLMDKGGRSLADPAQHITVHMRDGLIRLVTLCFEHFLERAVTARFSDEHVSFSIAVQEKALEVAGDLRCLFPRAWESSADPILAACAIVNDTAIVGGSVRFLRSQEAKLRQRDGIEEDDGRLVQQLLVPLARGLAPNWKNGNRREVGMLLAHVTGSGYYASRFVGNLARTLKKMEPVRLLEAHMACLRQAFDDWVESEPEEPDDDHPTDDENAAFEEAERAHKSQFEAIELLASRLSASLGVGQIRDKKVSQSLLGFVREGVRFAFSTKDPGYDEELPVGARLLFLRPVSKYLNWIRRDLNSKKNLLFDFNQREADLRRHADFANIQEQDLEAIALFRKAGELGEAVLDDPTMTTDSRPTLTNAKSSTAARPSRLSLGSSISSIRTKTSGQASLSPLPEEEDVSLETDDEGDSGSNRDERKRSSSSFREHTQGVAADDEDTTRFSDDVSPASPKRQKVDDDRDSSS